MALHSFLGMEIGATEPDVLHDFYQEIGLARTDGLWGTADVPRQIRVEEAPWRQLLTMRVGCESEADLSEIARRLEGLGVASRIADGTLRCNDPVNDHEVAVEVSDPVRLSQVPPRARNGPGARTRELDREYAVLVAENRPPRRLGHVVLGTPDPKKAREFYVEGLGFRPSDTILGIASFLRCSGDHHNLLLAPGPVPYLNHYAFEHDDIDALAHAASSYLRRHEDEDRHVVGIGRHVIGSNVYWYMLDPAGNMFEFFTDMDFIPDDDAWKEGTDWAGNEFSVWGPATPPEIFFNPSDLGDIAKAREQAGR